MSNSSSISNDADSLLGEAFALLKTAEYASSSLIQRRMSIGYARAARIIDQLCECGILGPADGSKPRKILLRELPVGFVFPETIDPLKPFLDAPAPEPSSWQSPTHPASDFLLHLGQNKQKKPVTFDLAKYGNLILVGSHLTNVLQLTNQLLQQEITEKSPEDLKLIVVDPFINQLKIADNDPHLFTPVIKIPNKATSALKWLCVEMEKRYQLYNLEELPTILLVINTLPGNFSKEFIEVLVKVFSLGRKTKVYAIISFDHLSQNLRKDFFVNIGAKIVFKPTTVALADQNGIPESIELTSPDEAILETMYEGREKINISK